MNDWIKQNVGYNRVLVSLFILLISFLAVKVYDKVDVMPDKFVRIERYTVDQVRLREQYLTDQQRVEKTMDEIQKDVKEILKVLR